MVILDMHLSIPFGGSYQMPSRYLFIFAFGMGFELECCYFVTLVKRMSHTDLCCMSYLVENMQVVCNIKIKLEVGWNFSKNTPL